MKTTIRKIGNSLGNTIPAAFARDIGVEEGSEINITIQNGNLIIEPIRGKKPFPYSEKDLLKGLTNYSAHADEIAEISSIEWGE